MPDHHVIRKVTLHPHAGGIVGQSRRHAGQLQRALFVDQMFTEERSDIKADIGTNFIHLIGNDLLIQFHRFLNAGISKAIKLKRLVLRR